MMNKQKRVENEIKGLEKDLEEIDPIEKPKRHRELQETIEEIERNYAKEEDEYWEERREEDYG